MSDRAAPDLSLARGAFLIAFLAYVLVTQIAPPRWHLTPWLAGSALVVSGMLMALRPAIFAFAHPFGVRLAGIFILGISAFTTAARLIELY